MQSKFFRNLLLKFFLNYWIKGYEITHDNDAEIVEPTIISHQEAWNKDIQATISYQFNTFIG